MTYLSTTELMKNMWKAFEKSDEGYSKRSPASRKANASSLLNDSKYSVTSSHLKDYQKTLSNARKSGITPRHPIADNYEDSWQLSIT